MYKLLIAKKLYRQNLSQNLNKDVGEEKQFPFTLLGSWVADPCNKKVILTGNKTKQNTFDNMYISCIHRRDPGKLTNSLKWPKP